ncbi:MAG TPA: KTSC domain-containing protein [Flavisolibacter sp.]
MSLKPIKMSSTLYTPRSSTIHRICYREDEALLEIEFRTGNVYHYYDIAPRMWKLFLLYIECEGSAGTFFNEYIRNRFTCEKVFPRSGEAR